MANFPMRTIKGILFDFDGTLVSVALSNKLAITRVASSLLSHLEARNLGVNRKKLIIILSRVSLEMSQQLLYNRNIWWNEATIRLNLVGSISAEFCSQLTRTYWVHYLRGMVEYVDVVPTLRALKSSGYKLGLVTDTDGTPGFKLHRISKSRLSAPFDAIVIAGEETERVKPDPSGYELALDKLRLRNVETIFVGDSLSTDIKGAQALGLATVLVRRENLRHTYGESSVPDFTIRRLGQLIGILASNRPADSDR